MKQLHKPLKICWVTFTPTRMPLYATNKVTWCSAFTVADLTYRNPRPEADIGGVLFRVTVFGPKWQQLCYSHHFTNYYNCHYISFRVGLWRSFYRRKGGSCITKNIRRNGTSATGHTHSSEQLNLWWNHEQKIQQKRSNEKDMGFYWVIDRFKQKKFDVFWNLEW